MCAAIGVIINDDDDDDANFCVCASQTFEWIWDDYIWPWIYQVTFQSSKTSINRRSYLVTSPPPLSTDRSRSLSTFLPVDEADDDQYDVSAPASEEHQPKHGPEPEPQEPQSDVTSHGPLQHITEHDEYDDDDVTVTSVDRSRDDS